MRQVVLYSFHNMIVQNMILYYVVLYIYIHYTLSQYMTFYYIWFYSILFHFILIAYLMVYVMLFHEADRDMCASPTVEVTKTSVTPEALRAVCLWFCSALV